MQLMLLLPIVLHQRRLLLILFVIVIMQVFFVSFDLVPPRIVVVIVVVHTLFPLVKDSLVIFLVIVDVVFIILILFILFILILILILNRILQELWSRRHLTSSSPTTELFLLLLLADVGKEGLHLPQQLLFLVADAQPETPVLLALRVPTPERPPVPERCRS